ncbi:pyridoxamine 5'-phosphate oxidase family protein [Streptomyces sp. GC420]|uniref:helix-turn-helix domain-containing protein n=1 Tax=Streptomyces sp. GC420 TaxID=2697568 RepID=UPI0014150D45|nr:pyridoxamine 5'-phosphate oxidase family protein [Streptomyces sp. GC420]NBM19808.1 helix-turn-helix domain-containing protein [Streptomyces sp. GC420]
MPEDTPSGGAAVAPGSARGDIGRRAAQRREELGLTREEVAARAGTAPGYLKYLEEQPGAAPGIGMLLRLADALGTTVTALAGGGIDLPPGIGRAAGRTRLAVLSPEECRARLGGHGIGRVAVATAEGPAILPVNYSVVDDDIVFRTLPESALAAAAGTETAFEVDHIDEALSRGWSVLVRGPARLVTDPQAVARLNEQAFSEPWADGGRNTWVAIEPAAISGREVADA